ncbi:MAG: hypothetical protein M3Y29_04900, partial [Chloroflexota bacterium]|nr:hypothetical protein [Chloroflexota bacterium]
IYQADPDEHPPLKTLHQTNLPIPATQFLGRDAELADLRTLLVRDDVRLITLTGPGGTGKTRLALQAAAEAAEHFAAGVWWVPLAPLRDPALVLESAAKALGASGDLAEHIGDKRMLLLLDNFEHLTDAAADLGPLLGACPHLTILVTSREPLHLAAEHEVAVDPLDRRDAIDLFLTRALAVKHDFAANGEVAQICERLDHLPLAIELAAARVKVLSPQALLERLTQRLPLLAGGARDLPERQRTLRATIEWSFELLHPDEQRLFARLAVFRGGWTLDAAEAVADADLDTLQSLVDKSLVRVRPESGRFWMLETIREFAVERLTSSDEAQAMRDRHADYFVTFAEEAEQATGPNHEHIDVWLPRLEADHDNLRAALEHLTTPEHAEAAQQLAGALWKFWYMTGSIGEGLRRLAPALAYDTPRTAYRARALDGGSAMHGEAGDPATARRMAEESVAINRELGDEFATALAEFHLANVEADDGNWAKAREMMERSRAVFKRLRPLGHYALLSTRVLSWVALEMGDRTFAQQLAEQNLRDARAAGNQRIEAMTLGQLAFRAIDDGELGRAAPMARDGYRMTREQGDRKGVAGDLYTIARLLAAANRPADAARVLSRSLALYDELGMVVPSYDRAEIDKLVDRLRTAIGEDELARATEAGRTLTDEEVDAIVDDAVAALT